MTAPDAASRFGVETWRPTAAHVRAVAVSAIGIAAAVLARRPDLLVLVTPLAVVATWASATRPSAPSTVDQRLGHAVLHEGQATTWHVDVLDHDPLAEDVAIALDPTERVEMFPPEGRSARALRDDPAHVSDITIRPTRWGRYRIVPAVVVVSSSWGAFRSVVRGTSTHGLAALARPVGFDSVAPPVRTPGLVGRSRSPRPGSGSEFETIRPFQAGDRLRRIHWPRTLSTGTTHVRSTWADHDRHVVVLLDALSDIGVSEGVDGRSSSLDIGVRAGAAIARHHLDAGDRVSLVVMTARGVKRVPPGTGNRHLRRILDTLAAIEPVTSATDSGAVPRGLRHGELVVLLSPLLTTGALARAVALADRGVGLVAVDCLPRDVRRVGQDVGDPYADLAWRIELLDRDRRIRRAREVGIAVVPWLGAGSLDLVLRDLARHPGGRRAGAR